MEFVVKFRIDNKLRTELVDVIKSQGFTDCICEYNQIEDIYSILSEMRSFRIALAYVVFFFLYSFKSSRCNLITVP